MTHPRQPFDLVGKIKFAFDIYGHGNIGDDLMLDGFCRSWPSDLPCFGIVNPFQAFLLQRRFPQLEWRTVCDSDAHAVWLGVGDTPIQVLSGDFFLRFLEKQIDSIQNRNCLRLLIGIGVEAEAVAQAARFRRILKKIDFIWTRDYFSKEILTDSFGVSMDQIAVSGDLANVALNSFDCYECQTNRPIGLAFNCFMEHFPWRSIPSIVQFLRHEARKYKVVWLANETRVLRRQHSEITLYNHIAFILNVATRYDPIDLVMPNYYAGSTSAMIEHFSAFQTVISCRYHCILSAAWAGCRIAGIGRSSKISALCQDLGVPCIALPITRRALEYALDKACVVERQKLLTLANTASKALVEAAVLVKKTIQ